jgi:hypothetical protein
MLTECDRLLGDNPNGRNDNQECHLNVCKFVIWLRAFSVELRVTRSSSEEVARLERRLQDIGLRIGFMRFSLSSVESLKPHYFT